MTKRPDITGALILLAIGAASGYLLGISVSERRPADAAHPVSGVLCPVMHIIDGDTLSVWLDGAVETVRLLRIDTPEMGRSGYRRATVALEELVGRGPVRLEGETGGALPRDAYGRLLAYVYVGSRCANVEIVREGWSRYWTRYGRSRRLENDFLEAEREARESARGLWSGGEWLMESEK